MASSRKWWALAALALTTLTVGLDGTVLSVALPTLAADLGATTSDLQWFTTVYLLVLAAALLPAGMLGDRFGRKRLLLMSLGLFGAASVCCAYATSSGQLVLARAVLGLGAAVLMPLTSAVLTVLFEAGERARALSVWVTASALGIPLGPLVGGWLLDNFWWGSVFLINVPMVLLAGIAVALLVPESHGDRTRRFDPVGVLLSAAGLVTLTYGIIDAGERGWTAARPLTLVAAGVALLVVFATWQRRAAAPLVDLALFSSRGFTWGAILAMVPNNAMFGLLFSLPQLFQAVQGADALGTGLRLLPVIGGLMAGAPGGRADPERPARGDRRAGGHGGGPAGRRCGGRAHRLRLDRRVDHRGRVRDGTGHAAGHERRAGRAVARAQRRGFRSDPGDAAGRRCGRGGGAGRGAERRLPVGAIGCSRRRPGERERRRRLGEGPRPGRVRPGHDEVVAGGGRVRRGGCGARRGGAAARTQDAGTGRIAA